MAPQRPRVPISKAEQRGWCQRRSERGTAGFFLTQWWPWRNNSRRRQRPRVERLIARWAQSSSAVSQGLEGDRAAGAAWVGAAGEATQGGGGGVPIPVRTMEGLWG
jgi:hypothetical protein